MSLFGQSSSGSLFGQKPQAQQTSNLFGSTQAQQGPNVFGSSTSTSTPAQSGGMFSNVTSQAQQSGGVFGSATSQPQQSGGLFGSTATNQQQQGASLFGSNNAQTQTQSSGLFGNTGQQQSNSLFTKPASTPLPTSQTGGLFSSATTSQNKPSLSLFGQNQNQNSTQVQQTSLFGGSNATQSTQNQGGLFPNVSSKLPPLGQTQQQQQSVAGVRIDVSQMRGTTRFVDLHDDLQKQIEQIDGFIQQQISFKEQCDAMMPAHGSNVQSIPTDVKFLKSMVEGVESSTEGNARAVSQLKELVNKDADNARLSFRAVENLKLPSYFHYNGSFGPGGGSGGPSTEGEGAPDLISYFSNAASDMSNTLSMYEKNITEIESHLKLVEANAMTEAQQMMLKKTKEGGERGGDDQVKELAAVLREFESGIMGVAGRVGQLREYMQELALTLYK